MALQISDVVRVTAQIAPQGVLRRDFGRALYLVKYGGAADSRAEVIRTRSVPAYASAAAVAADWGVNHEIAAAARIYFSQAPFPRNFMAAVQATQNQAGFIFGAPPAAISAIEALGDGHTLTIAGVDFDVDLDGVTTMAAVATALQTGLRTVTGLAAATAEIADGAVKITLPHDYAVGGGFAAEPGAAALGLAPGAAQVFPGFAAEANPDDALARIRATNDEWYFLVPGDDYRDTADIATIASWARANPVMLAFDSTAAGVLTAGEATSQPAVQAALGSERVFAVWSRTADHKAASAVARLSSVNFSRPGALINLKFKSLPGTLPDSLTSAQKAELDRKRVNHYSPFGGDSIFAEGTSFGTWIDARFWLDWLVNAVQVEVYNLLRQSPAKIPQTSEGVAAVQGAIERVCEQGVVNGGAAPGQLSPALAADVRAATGNEDFSGYLSTGYLVSIADPATQTQAERNTRAAPPARIWIKGSGAINFADIDITFEN